jgi:hypothetical protein
MESEQITTESSQHKRQKRETALVEQKTQIQKLNMAEWNENTKVLYWKHQANLQDLIETQKSTAEEDFNEGFEKGLEKAKLKGEIKGEISKVKSLIKFKIAEEEIIKDLKFLTHEKVLDKLESNLQYISEHIGDTDSQICEELGLLGDLSDFE